MKNRLTQVLLGAFVALSAIAPQQASAKWVFANNHPDLDWYSIETEHFVTHYPVSRKTKEEGNEHYLTGEWSARRMAQVAEQSWPKMCAEFNYYLKEKVHIVLLNQGDDLEGFTVPSLDWIEISANPGGMFYRGRGRMEWISDVFVHEFAHVVSLKANAAMAEGNFGVVMQGLYQNGANTGPGGLGTINNFGVGAEMRLMDSDSVFWTEGGAEYWSDNVGHNWWTTSRDQNIRMTVLEDRLLRYDEWHNRSFKRGWNDSERYYQQGYSFGLYLRQRFGDKTYAKFAIEHGRRWRWDWVTVIEDVLGITAEELYWDWRNYLTERYTAQYDAVKATGEVAGRELSGKFPAWEYTSPEGRDKWLADPKYKREAKKEGTGTWQFEPRVSQDGRFYGTNFRGSVVVQATSDDQFTAFSGVSPTDPDKAEAAHFLSTSFPSYFAHGWDFVPGKDEIVVTGNEHLVDSYMSRLFRSRAEMDGYQWKQLWHIKMPTKDIKWGNREIEGRENKPLLGVTRYAKDALQRIPNTLRGSDPSMSPDGETVAYFEYTDGTLNLVTIRLDGSEKTHLTSFDDGTWLQTADWSPDGEQIAFAIMKEFQQNLYIINKDGSGLKAIMADEWEELDAHWSVDGKIYFSADPGGIFNIFSYDPKTERFVQITNVISAATTPQISPEGNLVYTHYTAHGWKVYGLAKDEFLNAPADEHFNTDFNEDEIMDMLAFEEDLSHFAEVTTPYKASKAFMTPAGIPMFTMENNGPTDVGLQAGGQLILQDYVEHHAGSAFALLGEDSVFQGVYTYQKWYPNISLIGLHYRGKSSRGFQLDDDDDVTTKDDQTIWETKSAQNQTMLATRVDLPYNSNWSAALVGSYLNFQVRGTSDPQWEQYLYEYETALQLGFANVPSYYAGAGNLTFGREIELLLSHGWVDVTYPALGGVTVDDGMVLDDYQYNKVSGAWTENFRIPTLGGIPFMKKAHQAKHVIQVDAQLGFVDRNVDTNDEFRAGGRHPANAGWGTIRPNTQFAGYPGWSLSGETMAIMNMAYRFPINAHSSWRWGPFTTSGIYGQFGGTAGNLWSFRPPSDSSKSYRSQYDDRIAYNPADVRREIPFIDIAKKNGNYMLYDAFAEVRIASIFRDTAGWDSFLRMAYGFQEIGGYGDVNEDGVWDTSENGVGDELSVETEPAGWRVYLGFGTGW